VNTPILQATGVRAGYQGCEVLQGISFDLHPGEVLGVIGPNGSGKSTLLKAVTGLLPLIGGKVQIAGKDLSNLGFRERARICAVQPQVETPLFDYSIREFVLLGRHPHRPLLGRAGPADLRAVDAALTMTDLLPLASRSIRSLSTGEWQRSLLARALAQEAPLLMLDEPAAHLDPGHGYDTHALLRKISREKDRSVLCVSHDLNLAAEFCDRLMMLASGRVRALGRPEEVLTAANLQAVFQCDALRVAPNPFTGRPGTVFVP
jgi:iron complex transport system ATP-binding protein